jgi:hypothetical protein
VDDTIERLNLFRELCKGLPPDHEALKPGYLKTVKRELRAEAHGQLGVGMQQAIDAIFAFLEARPWLWVRAKALDAPEGERRSVRAKAPTGASSSGGGASSSVGRRKREARSAATSEGTSRSAKKPRAEQAPQAAPETSESALVVMCCSALRHVYDDGGACTSCGCRQGEGQGPHACQSAGHGGRAVRRKRLGVERLHVQADAMKRRCPYEMALRAIEVH